MNLSCSHCPTTNSGSKVKFFLKKNQPNNSPGVLFGREEYMLAQVPSIFIIVALMLWVNVIFDYSFYVGFNRYV